MKQCQCTAGDAKVRKAFEEDSVANGVKGSSEVEEDEDTGLTGVCSDEKVIGDLHQSGLMCYGVFCMLTEEVQGFSGCKERVTQLYSSILFIYCWFLNINIQFKYTNKIAWTFLMT